MSPCERLPPTVSVVPPSSEPDSCSDALLTGELEIVGRVLPASNATFLAEAVCGDHRVRCVYKPKAGERPLWDFPDGTLAARERAAYLISEALGWDIVPRTVLRDGPAGPGMVQEWREPVEDSAPVDLCAPGRVPPGFRHVLDALDGDGEAVSLVHEDSVALRRMAVFDAVVNNADRKGGHVLAMHNGHCHGVDHGVCFHAEDKLRTVLWGWAGEPLVPAEADELESLLRALDDSGSALVVELAALLAPEEMATLRARARGLLGAGTMPMPSGSWPSIPWPAF